MQRESHTPIQDYIAELLNDPAFAPQIAGRRTMPSTEAIYGENHYPWPGAVSRLLNQNQIRLFSHQALATDHIRAGRSIVIATPTASGKSLIYNLSALEAFLQYPDARALYLFPLKALAQDQLAAFNALCSRWPSGSRPSAALYDGDVSDYRRKKIRNDPPTVLLTNPEMLHHGILPFHENWSAFLGSLAFVVVDEAHIYRGVFGSHMSQVFYRLNRLAAHYGANPAYIFCTATLGNPAELAAQLMGSHQKPVLVDQSGAPQGKRNFFFIDPDASAATCAIDLLKRALEKNLRVIVYCQSRRMTELISLWAGANSPHKDSISAYRAGFLPEERREIEARMASGELKAVISTSALELGIDIGGLDVCILAGYPGTVMQTLQRCGRVGRSGQESAVFIIAGEDALDQYFARNPEAFFSRPPEKAVINPENEVVISRHLECAAAESPLNIEDEWDQKWLEKPSTQKALKKLVEDGALLQTADRLKWVSARKKPQRFVNLRGSGDIYSIENETGAIMGTMDGLRVWKEAHPGAVYLHHGRHYLIANIEEDRRIVHAAPVKADWFTRARIVKNTEILEEYERKILDRCVVCCGRLKISERVTSYEKRISSSQKLVSVTPLKAPWQIFETEGLWIVFPDEIRTALESSFIHYMGSIHAFEHAAIGILPLEVLADRNDFGGISTPLHPGLGFSAVFLYDAIPGGAGLSKSVFQNPEAILKSVHSLISTCPCEDGCPSCIQSPKCGAGNRPLSKAGSLALLHELLLPGDEGERIHKELEKQRESADRIVRSTSKTAAAKPSEGKAEGKGDFGALPAFQTVSHIKPGPYYAVFDLETRRTADEVGGWHKASQMGVSVAVLYDSKLDDYFRFSQDELPALFEKMRKVELIIGFNIFKFDYQVLRPFLDDFNRTQTKQFILREAPAIDLLQRLKQKLNYYVSLNNFCYATFGAEKSSDGLQAVKWWREGQLDKLASYCQRDVELTKNLYLYGLENRCAFFTNKAGQKVMAPADFEFKK